MRRHALLFALLLPALAAAQTEFQGLDLSGETKPEEQPQDPGAESKPAEGEAPAPETPRKALIEETKKPVSDDPPLGERDITQEDRVKSVQRKVYLKKSRFELAPAVSFQVNDPYYRKVGLSLRGAYFLSDTLAVGVRGGVVNVSRTDDVKIAKFAFQSRIFFSVPQWFAMGNVEWSPVYGKVAWFNSILHFDAYLLGGMGVVNTETSALPDRGPNVGFDLGAGMRFVAKDFLAVNVALINTSYVDQPAGTNKAATQNMMTLNAGVSVFFPLKSTGREAE